MDERSRAFEAFKIKIKIYYRLKDLFEKDDQFSNLQIVKKLWSIDVKIK